MPSLEQWHRYCRKEPQIYLDTGSNRAVLPAPENHFRATQYLPATIVKYQKRPFRLLDKYPQGWDPEINSGGQFYPILSNYTLGVTINI